jgi:hypothetical protein
VAENSALAPIKSTTAENSAKLSISFARHSALPVKQGQTAETLVFTNARQDDFRT